MILVATGLQREARILAGEGLSIIAGGGRSAELEQALEAQAADAEACISIGLAGALNSDFPPGAWVVGVYVIDGAQRLLAPPTWRHALLRALPNAIGADIAGADEIASDVASKDALARRTGAAAVDMESHVLARVAARHAKPFAVARVISDGAAEALPPAALIAMKADGAIDIGAVVKSLVAHPGQIAALARTAVEARTAFRALFRGRQILGHGLGFPGADLGHFSGNVT